MKDICKALYRLTVSKSHRWNKYRRKGDRRIKTANEIKGSTTIENIIYEKHIGEEVSRVGLHPTVIPNGRYLVSGKRKRGSEIV